MTSSGLDESVTALVNGLSGNPLMDAVVIAITTYGPFVIVALVAVRWWWSGGAKMRERYLAILCGASVALGLAMNQVILLFLQRPRPYDVGLTHPLTAPTTDPSFPSDHATIGFAIAFALLAVGARRGWAFLAAAVVLSASRMYVGAHYLTDLIGGALMGAIAVALCVAVLRPSSRIVTLASRVL